MSAKASGELQRYLANPPGGKLLVFGRLVGEIHVKAQGANGKPVTVLVPGVCVPRRSVNLLDSAPLASWRASASLRDAVAGGYIQLIKE